MNIYEIAVRDNKNIYVQYTDEKKNNNSYT